MRVSSGDAEISYEVLGSGPDVVLLHAFPVHHAMWLPAAQRLARNYRVILPDLRGHGRSGVGAGPATMAKHAEDVLRVCDAAEIAEKAIFGGVSIGGYILFELWRRAPQRVSALIFSDTRAAADSDEARAARLRSAEEVERRGPSEFLAGMIPKLLGATTLAERPDVVATVRLMTSQMTAEGIAAVQRGMAARPDSRATLATIDVPTLVIVGDEDTVATTGDAELMRQGIGTSSLVIVPRAGHLGVLEQHEAATEAITHFLDGLRIQ